MKNITLKQYIKLSNIINSVEDIEMYNVSLLEIYERIDCDFDKFYGRGISAIINENIRINWFESDDRIIACATLLENESHTKIIKNRIFDCLSDKLWMSGRIGRGKWDDKTFTDAHKHFKKIQNNLICQK
jgi:hypothetical protein